MLVGLLPTTAFAADKHPAEPAALAGARAVSVQSNDAHTHCVCGGNVESHKHETSSAAWQSWDGTGEITYTDGSARVYLTKEISANLTVPSGSTLTLCLNGKAFTCKDKSLAAITLENAALNLCDCIGTGTIGGRTSGEKGGSIQARFSNVNLYGGTLTGNSGLNYGGGISFEGGTFSMNGGAIKGNSAKFGGGIFGGEYSSNLGGNAYIGIHGGEISGNTATQFGGGFYAATGFINLLISGGQISGNRANENGGGLSIAAGRYNITGGKIQNNTAGNQGGGLFGGNVNGTITGGEITGNTAKSGGGIYEVKRYSTPIAYYSDCKITGNSATEKGGGVYFEGSMPEMLVYGNLYISGNTLNGKPSNLCAEKSNMRYLIGDPMGENARVDISFTGLASGEIIRSSSVGNYYTTKADIAKFRSETEGFYIVASEQPDATYGYTGSLSVNSNHKHCACGGDVTVGDHTTHTEQTFLPWSGGDAGYKNGVAYVYLKQNITLNSNLTVTNGNTLYLCLHGNTITSNGTNKIVVEKGSRLVICDCSGGGVIKGATKGWGGTGIYVYQSTLDIFGGKITGGKVSSGGGGGAIALDDKKCVLNIYGGELSGNNGRNAGGAIFLNDNNPNNEIGGGTVNLYGGKICNNTATNGGAIYAVSGGNINLIGGEISGNTSTNDGGAVYGKNAARIKITGTKLTENKGRYGGAICLVDSCTLIMEKGEISKNQATEGGAVSVFGKNSTFTLVNGSIIGNSATDGGAVYLNQDNSIFNMGGGTISGNTATGNGGAVYTYRDVSVMTMSGGTIEKNTAGKSGGAVYINKGQLNLMDAPVIRNNTVSGKANNVYLKNGKMLTAYYFKSTEKIGVTTETLPTKGNPVVFCEDSDKDYSDKFVSDRDGYMVYYNEDGHLALSTVFYTVTYRPGTEGTGSEAVDHKDKGETLELRGETFTRTGYRQIGWALSEGGEQAYALGASYSTNAPLVLYPVWEMKNGYTVNFVNDDDTPVGTRTVAWADTVLSNAPEVTEKGAGWDFKGWFCGETLVVPDTTYAALAKDDTVTSITLKAAWTDTQKPTVSGIEDGKTYCGSVRFTVTDNDAVQKVYDRTSGKEFKPESDGSYLLPPSADSYTLEITDPSGNVTKFTVKVNDDHQYDGWETGDGKYWRACSVCGEPAGEKKDIPACVYQLPDTLCPRTDLVFTFTVPTGSTLETVEYGTGTRISDSGLQRNQDGSYTATLPYSNFDTEGRVSLKIQAKTSDGYTFVTDLGVVTVLAEHPWGAWSSNHDGTHSRACTKDPSHTETKSCTGGEATCLAPATCADCGESYGDQDPLNHAMGADWVRTETTHEKKYLCCGVVEVEKETHEWDNGACTECGYGCTHTGGEATCTEKAVCDICGQPYGELAPDAHTAEPVWTTTAETHTKTYPCCGAVEVDQKPHKWTNGACTECGYECLHTGGEATCAEQATCEICGEKYGDLKPHSYSTAWSTDETHHWHECTKCGAKTDKTEHTDTDRDHKCDLCDRTFSEHSGGTATCTDKAKCDVCGESYGELNANNHTDLKYFPAKAATRTSEGNIAYWYCSGCGKYCKDAEATQEITKEQTITAKLPRHTGGSTGADTGNKPDNDAVTSPNTGDNSKLALWSVTLCGSLAACLALAAAQRRRKRER